MKRFITRVRAAYNILFSKRFLVIVYNDHQECVDSYFNVTHEGFRALVETVDAGYEQLEAQDAVITQAKKILA
jgi:hypothetical protein